jgi:hypothetical protein
LAGDPGKLLFFLPHTDFQEVIDLLAELAVLSFDDFKGLANLDGSDKTRSFSIVLVATEIVDRGVFSSWVMLLIKSVFNCDNSSLSIKLRKRIQKKRTPSKTRLTLTRPGFRHLAQEDHLAITKIDIIIKPDLKTVPRVSIVIDRQHMIRYKQVSR